VFRVRALRVCVVLKFDLISSATVVFYLKSEVGSMTSRILRTEKVLRDMK
jgi:hypothetical protein